MEGTNDAVFADGSCSPSPAQTIHVHVLVSEESFETLRRRTFPPSIRLHKYDQSTASSFPKTPGGCHVLLIENKFSSVPSSSPLSSQSTFRPMPGEVRSAALKALRSGGRVCTLGWVDDLIFLTGTEDGRRSGISPFGGVAKGDLTGHLTTLFQKQLREEEVSKMKADDSKTSATGKIRQTRPASAAGGKNEIVDLTSDVDGGGNDDEVVIVPPSKHCRAGDATFGSALKRVKTALNERPRDSASDSYDEEKVERIRTRNVRKLVSFHATWLRGLKGFKEAKAKARPDSPLESDSSPEAQVLAKAKEFFRQRKERGQTWKYAFEQCYDEEVKSKQHDKDATLPNAADSQIKSRNVAIAKRLRSLVAAQAAIDEIRRVSSDKYRGTVDEGDDESGRALTSAEVEQKARTKKKQQPFRELHYDRVARAVESYPVAVTLDCLESPPDFATLDAPSNSHSTAIWAKPSVRKIKCGGSVRDRLIRAVLYVDRNPMLYGDDDHRRDEAMLKNRDFRAIDELRKIWGVGLTTAARLTSWGVYSVADLRRDMEVYDALNHQQKVGLARYEDISLNRIPRAEVEAIRSYVSATVAELSGNQVTVTACGSYRRGASSSGDVDLILLPNQECFGPSSHDSCRRGAPDDAAIQVMDQVLQKLKGDGFLTDDLTVPNQFGENDGKNPGTDSRSYMGVCRLPDRPDRKSRRIDIKAYPSCQGPFALLYFTGDTHFNRSMRAFAKKAGLTMSDAGLACCDRNRVEGKYKRTKTYGSVRCRTEEEVFAALGIGYVSPHYRNCGKFQWSRSRESSEQRWDNRFLVESDESDDEDY